MKSNTKSIATILAVIPMSLLSFSALSQGENLVENGGFESTSGKAKKLGAIEMATGWVSPTGVRADLYTPAAKVPEISTPTNFYGIEAPKEGSNYAGIYAFSYNDKVPRSYIMAKLTSPLKKGMTYCVQFNVSLAELSKYASNDIAAHISKKAFGTEEKSSIIDKSHIIHPDNKIFNALFGWDKVCGTFVAEGGEKYITIGNFTNNANTKYEKSKKPDNVKGTPVIGAYYYIDDVSVVLLETGQACDCGGPAVDENAISSTIYSRSINVSEKMTPTQKIEVQAAYFGFGKDLLQPAALNSLDLIANEMKANPTFKLEIYGHSNEGEIERGNEKEIFANMDQKRIDAVKTYLKEKGIAENRLIAVTKGSSEPSSEVSASDDDDLAQAKNRRVTFKVIK